MREVNVYDKLRQKAIMKIIIQKESREKYCFKIGFGFVNLLRTALIRQGVYDTPKKAMSDEQY